jgi:hypothetical protein
MSALDRLIPAPRLVEIDHVDVAVDPARAWERVRHGEFATSPLVRALFALRELPDRLAGRHPGTRLRLDDLVSTPRYPGFHVFVDEPPVEVAVGAIGKVWKPEIPFVHVDGAAAFAAFAEPDYVRVAWAVRVERRSHDVTRIELEVRVDATDEAAWRKFRTYFLVVGPASRFIRRTELAAIAHDVEGSRREDDVLPLPGDALLPDAFAQLTDGITIHATPEAIWPWLVQMGCDRAGYYSIDLLDNANRRSAREIHPELQSIAVGDVLPARPGHSDGFEVLAVDEPRALVLGGLFDGERQLRFTAPRPERWSHVTWAFALEPLDASHTRLRVRVRVAFPQGKGALPAWIGPLHRLMEHAQLANLAARAEGRATREDWRDLVEGTGGAARVLAALFAPHRRAARSHWGLTAEEAARPFPGDDLVPDPTWGWTHAVVIDAPASATWPWIAQIGADRAGFYSYQWLENLFGSDLANAERVRPEWEVRAGEDLVLHPKLAPLTISHVEPGRWFVAHADDPEVSVSWLFQVEPIDDGHCRFVSRYRCRSGGDLETRLEYGPWLAEPLGFAMDRKMLLGVKERAERAAVRGAVT